MHFHLNDFRAIYDQHVTMVYNLSLSYLQNQEEAEEITQDVFVQVHQSLHKFRNDATFKTWIYRITINKCLDFIKHKSSKKRFFVFGKKADAELELGKISTFDHPGVQMEQKENAEMLFGAINQLPENQKTAFLLSKLEGLPNAEIAAIMETTVASVESLLFRAKTSLREKLSEKFENYRKKKK